MKKRISVLVAAVLAIGCLATACGGNAGGEVKVGLGLHTDFSYGSADATAEKDGTAQADLHIAAVTVDADGKIVSVKVDAIQVSSRFDTTGKITSDVNAAFQTKKELGNDYNMMTYNPAASGEWFEQAAAFEGWCVGKTATEVQAALGSDGYPATEIVGCTIKVNGLVPAVVKAVNNAVKGNWTASSSDTLGIGMTASIDNYADATADANGTSRAYANFTAVTYDANGKITACVLDSVQAAVTWDTTGKITSDLTVDTTSKYDLKEGYGMKDYSASQGVIEGGGEWYEQADAFMAYVKGMTSSDVAAIAIDESGYPAGDGIVGCTMNVSTYITAVTKALAK